MRFLIRAVLAAQISLTVVACSTPRDDDGRAAAPADSTASPPSQITAEINPRLLRRFQPLPDTLAISNAPTLSAEVDLGRMLFFDPRMSKGGDVSCNSCHELTAFGVDSRKSSIGFNGHVGTRNAPSVYNAGGHFAQFWDGRAADVEAQAKLPVLNPGEMAMPDAASVVSVLKNIPGYSPAFQRAFPNQADPVTFDNFGIAIGAFERGLLTPSRWDKYLRGDKDALTPKELKGLKTFLDVGCMVCHTGAYVGGSMFERVGVVEPWPNQTDLGRFEVTKAPSDRMMFKVPSLRNVEKTAPYFHDGSAATLEQAVQMMGRHQLGLELGDQEVASIVTWLKALTGDLPSPEYLAKPVLPASH